MPLGPSIPVLSCCCLIAAGAPILHAQSNHGPVYRVDVNLVAVTFRVTDKSGRHVGGLQPSDVRVFEDGIPQSIASFASGSTLVRLLESGPDSTGTSVFLLFDTSNRMYSSYPFVRDAIAGFIRRLAPQDSAAIYTFSRNLFRASRLTHDHVQAAAGLDNMSAGDDAALFNALLLTLRDAAKIPGRKAVVLFSNSRDNASVLGPDDVGRVAEDEGIPVYVISTRDAPQDKAMFDALHSLAVRTGGKLYYAQNWQKQAAAFQSVRDDIRSSYTAYYYPAPNPNQGFRNIKIEIASPAGRTYRIVSRSGYRPHKEWFPSSN
jgi:VWFA-related protein